MKTWQRCVEFVAWIGGWIGLALIVVGAVIAFISSPEGKNGLDFIVVGVLACAFFSGLPLLLLEDNRCSHV